MELRVQASESLPKYLVGMDTFWRVADPKPPVPLINSADLVPRQWLLMRLMQFDAKAMYRPTKKKTLVITGLWTRCPWKVTDTDCLSCKCCRTWPLSRAQTAHDVVFHADGWAAVKCTEAQRWMTGWSYVVKDAVWYCISMIKLLHSKLREVQSDRSILSQLSSPI